MSTYILAGARTPIGSFQKSLARSTPIELGARASREAIARSGVPADAIDSAFVGNVIATEPRELYLSRVVALESGLPVSSTALGVNRLCGSGLQALVSAAQHIAVGDGGASLVCGTEVMSRAPYSARGMRGGKKLGDGVLEDWLTGSITDPMGNGSMGETAEKIAGRFGITRERQDAFALESQRRAAEAIAEGRFESQIVPVGDVDRDEHPRATTLEKLASLRPAFRADGTVTAGNSSGINDAAAALVVAGDAFVEEHGARPLARIAGWAVAGVEPAYMGLGPVRAVPRALAKAGLRLEDIDWIEANEAFAAQALAVQDELGLDPERTNPDGGAIALGHPIGATGTILVVKLLHRLQATGARFGLVTLCIGGGQGIALVLENVA